MATKRNILVALALAATSLMPAMSQAHPGAWMDHGRPPQRAQPHYARPGHAWAPGYWRWNGHRHLWDRGHYVREHRGDHWTPPPPHWEQHGGHRPPVPGHRWR